MLGLGLTCRPGNRLCGSPAQRPVICSAALVGSDARRRADYLRAELCKKWYCLYCESRLDSAFECMEPSFGGSNGSIARVDPVTCVQPSLCAGTTGVAGPGCWASEPRPPLAGGPYRAPSRSLPTLAQASPWWRREACRRAVVGGIRCIWRRVHGSSHVAPSCSCRWNGLSGSDRPGRYRGGAPFRISAIGLDTAPPGR